ncbi:PilW family protein [Neobacillus jeddahensis]|uniref:PilW family protein n=1 Tax=Neobacillus jeddahensis TaxID=1461580 RepID=UPI00058D58CF|nr:prepilin-type N-terminal cleavage/methylation domain-containing protein [Neobacillus jeddahensis]
MKIFDEKGVTLIELLATITVLMIVLPVIYGVFSSGLKLYNKIQVEGQLRDDADYAVTMIMNTFYSYPFDEVKDCGGNCLELVNKKETKVEQVPGQDFYQIEKDKELLSTETTSIQIKVVETNETSKASQQLEIDGKILDGIYFEHLEISYSCNKQGSIPGNCDDGMIQIDLQLNNDRLNKPFNLTSRFGF